MADNNIKLKSINEIFIDQDKFLIPSYQRGYRWTKREVNDLLDDIWEFANREKKTKDEFYCLQPIVLKEKKGQWEVIDGQQRLTTILIILNYFNQSEFKTPKQVFEIEFQTRKYSQLFLQNINLSKKEENIDYFHICDANETITKWFTNKTKQNSAIANEFYPILINSTKFIWYHVSEDTDSIDIFTRINIGKIPLTNAELVKALFLRSDNFSGIDTKKIHLQQVEIANEWDNIEYMLHNEEFWYFLNQGENNLDTRIEFVFDLISEKNYKIDEYYTFRFFNNKFGKPNGSKEKEIKENWKEIKDYFLTFQEWFQDRDLYHFIGYLVIIGVSIVDLKKVSKNKTKKEFKKYLRELIKEKINCKIDKLDYSENNPNNIILKILLLYNIITILKNDHVNSRFPFNTYVKEKWGLEHIHAQNSKGLDTSDKRKFWLDEIKNTISEIDNFQNDKGEIIDLLKIINEISDINNKEKVTKEEFEIIQNEIYKLFGTPELHTIDNLALISGKDNSSLSNSIFLIKRNKVIELEKEGSFIPICTRNVFLKYYSKNASQLYFWGDNDRISYLNDIKEILSDYLTLNISEE